MLPDRGVTCQERARDELLDTLEETRYVKYSEAMKPRIECIA